MKTKVNKKRVLLALVVALFVAVAATTGVLAYMFRHAGARIDGTFEAQELTCQVLEEYDADTGIKSSIKVQNGGNGDCYIRLNLVSYWQDGDGNVVMPGVVGKPSKLPTFDYDIGHWLKDPNSDIYYYKTPVAAGDETEDLLTRSMTLVSDTWDNGQTVYQVVEVFAETIQASPADAVTECWGMNVSSNGTLSFPS